MIIIDRGKCRGGEAFERWKKENEKLQDIAQDVDIIFPSLYTFDLNMNDWQAYAIANIEEARKYGKPVYVFIWPMYHDSRPSLKGKYIPAEFWRFQLETCYDYADGIVIWGGWQESWNENAPWWRVTKSFLKKIKGDKDRNQVSPPTLLDIY